MTRPLSVLLMVLAALAGLVQRLPAVDLRDIYLKNFRADCAGIQDNSFLLVIENTSADNQEHAYMPLYFDCAVATEPDFTPIVEFVEGALLVTENQRLVEQVRIRPGRFPAFMDDDLVKPTLRSIGYFRDTSLHELKIKVCSGPRFLRDVSGRQALLADRLVFRVSVGKGTGASRSALRPPADPWSRPVLDEMVVNREMLPHFPAPGPREQEGLRSAKSWSERLAAASERMPLLRIRCAVPGVYAVYPDDLKKEGIDPASIDFNAVRLVEGGKEIPLFIDRSDGPGKAWKALVFYSPGADMVRKPHRTYWLLSEPDGTAPPLRIADSETKSGASDQTTSSTTVSRRKSYFEFRNYSHVMPPNAAHGRWSWVSIPQEEYREVEILVPGGGAPSGESRLSVEVAGLWREGERRVDLYWNRRLLTSASIRGNRVEKIETPIPSDRLVMGVNTLAVEFSEPMKGRLPDSLELTDVTLSWSAPFASPDNQAPWSFTTSPDESNQGGKSLHLKAPGIRPESLFVLDITEPAGPKRVVFHATSQEGSFAGRIAGAGERRCWAAASDTLLRPWRIERRAPPELTKPGLAADYIAVSVEGFGQPAARLLDLKKEQGLRTTFVDVEEIYDAFDHGVKSAAAIAEFLRYAYWNWAPPRPYYVCLIGETSDFLADAQGVPPNIQKDLVPNFEWGNPDSRARGDYKYSYITENDFIGDLSVGRISVADAGELNNAVDKIISYQTAPAQGAWRARHLFFTDDEREFQDIADLVIADAASSLSLPQRLFLNEYPYEPYFRHVERRRSLQATSQLKQRLSEGVATAVYLGHGGPNVMSSERLFYLQDIPTLRRGSPPTFLGSASCDTAWLDYPKVPFETSIGEWMVKIADRGAIGMFGPVSGASSSMHKDLFESWYQGVVGERLRRTGDITLYAQNWYFATRNSTFVPDQYVLIGDPALPLPEPRGKGLGLEISSTVLLKGVSENLEIKGSTQSIRYGWVDLSLRNSYGTPVVPDQRVRLIDGRFSLNMEVEGQATPGSLILRADAMNEPTRQWEMGYRSIEVVDPVLSVDVTTDPPPTTRFRPGEFSRLIQTVTNQTAHTLPRIRIQLMAVGVPEPLSATEVDLAPGEKWEQSIGGATPPGISRMELIAGRSGPHGLTPLARSELTVRAPSPTRAAALAMPESGLEAFMRPDGKGTEFMVQLENLSARELRNLAIQIWEFAPPEDISTTLTETTKVVSIPPSAGVTLRMLSPKPNALFSSFPVLVMVRNDPAMEPTAEMPATVIFERNAVVLPHVNVRIIPESVELSSTEITRDETTFISAEVENIGRESVHNVLVEAFLDAPWDRKNWIRPNPYNYEVRVPELPPFQKARVRVRFDMPPGVIGQRDLFVVANSRRQFAEDTYHDNVGKAKVMGILLADLAVSPAETPTSPVLVRPGEVQELRFVVANLDSEAASEPTEVAIESLSPGRDWSVAAPQIPLRSVGPGQSAPMKARWTPQGNETQVRITANAERFFLERSQEDNRLVFPVLSQVDAQFSSSAASSDSSSVWSQRSIFHLTVFDLAVQRPTSRIVFKTPRVEGQSGIPFDYPISARDVVAAQDLAHLKPGVWSFVNGTFATPAAGEPAPIVFHLERPEGETEFYDFYFQVPSARAMPDGKAKGKILVKVGKAQEPVLLNGIDEYGFWCYAGRHPVPAGGIDVEFRKPNEQVHTGVQRYLLFPSVGRLTSPAIRFQPEDPPFRAEIVATTPGKTSVSLYGRWGKLEGQAMAWSEWTRIASLPSADGDSAPVIRPENQFLQWEARLYPTDSASPELADIVFRPQ